MLKLSLENYHDQLQISEDGGDRYVFDPVRKRHFKIQPEELVRQSWIQMLIAEFNIQTGSLGVEKQFTLLGQKRRFDLVYFKKAIPYVLFEFKRFSVSLSEDTAYQAANYNLELNVPYIVISNGISHFAFKIDKESNECLPLSDLSFLEI